MKKSILKTVRIVAFTVAISLTSCNNSTTTETVKETETVVELKITTPQPSPLGMVSQRVGLTDVAIEYSRPGVKIGRASCRERVESRVTEGEIIWKKRK